MGGRYTRLTPEQVARIRYLYIEEKLTGAVIATRTGLSKYQVYRALGHAARREEHNSKAA